jgi:hypothetical protein
VLAERSPAAPPPAGGGSLESAFQQETDSMTFADLEGLATQLRLKSPADITDLAALEKLQADIMAGNLGVKQIVSHPFRVPVGPEKAELPRSFTLLGQKFLVDSWTLSRVVFDDIIWEGAEGAAADTERPGCGLRGPGQ